MPDSGELKVICRDDLIVTATVTDVLLAQAYIQMTREGTLETVFYEGVPTLADFMADCLTPGKRVTGGCFRNIPGKPPEFCGIGWVYNPVRMGRHTRADTGMCFFKSQTRKTDNLKFGQMLLEVFFRHYNIDALFGFTPEPNKLALRYAQKLGMTIHGPIPDYCTWKGDMVPGWISHISKADWMERNPQFFS